MTRGGKREGAGRKPLPPEKKRKPHTVWLSEEEAAWIRDVGEGNLSEGVRLMVEDMVYGLPRSIPYSG